MNEEEKKAIERLEEQLNFWKKQNIKNSDCEIILNLITKLQKENEEKDRQIKTLKHTNKTYKGMLNKQSKQIDLMAEIFYKKFKAELLLEYGFEGEEQLKQCFERKVRDVKN